MLFCFFFILASSCGVAWGCGVGLFLCCELNILWDGVHAAIIAHEVKDQGVCVVRSGGEDTTALGAGGGGLVGAAERHCVVCVVLRGLLLVDVGVVVAVVWWGTWGWG